MVNFKQLEEDVAQAARKIVADAEAHEPQIEDLVIEALGAAGAPGPVASAIGAALLALLNHFRSQQPAPSAVPADPAPPAFSG